MNTHAASSSFDPRDEALLLDTIDRWLEKDVRPVVKTFDHADKWPDEIVAQMSEFGLFGATISQDYGGLGLPAATFDRGERCDLEAGMAKYFASEAALENSIESLRIHGAYGYSKEYDIERLYRDAPLTCIGEGTNEMQRIIIARQWIKRSTAA